MNPFKKFKFRLKRYHKISLGIVLSVLLFETLPDWYLINLGRSFAIQLLLLYAVLALFYLIRKKWMIAFSCSLAAVIMTANYAEYVKGNQIISTSSASEELNKSAHLRIAQFNVLKFNRFYDNTIKQALATDADFISFQEVDYGWALALKQGLLREYPYYKMLQREDCYGLAVFSRFPITDLQTHYWHGMPNISGDLNASMGTVHFLASHTKSPITYRNYKLRNNQIDKITEYISKKEGAVLAVGDYNAVPWDKSIRYLKKETRLKDSRKSLLATYPSVLGPVGIPIDYIFHSNMLKCLQFDSIGGTYSDHLGVIGTYQFTAEPNV